jgi:hypothetical protein
MISVTGIVVGEEHIREFFVEFFGIFGIGLKAIAIFFHGKQFVNLPFLHGCVGRWVVSFL